jgi:hypothetical protein
MGYKDIYDDMDAFNIANEISKIPSITAIEVIAKYNRRMHARERDVSLQHQFLSEWMSWLSDESSSRIEAWIKRISAVKNRSVNLFNNRTSLIFAERVYENFNYQEKTEEFTEEEYEQFFKCYIYLSQQWIDESAKAIPPKIEHIEDYLKVILPLQLSLIEIIEFKDFRLQFLKAIYFFTFCENDPVYNKALIGFLQAKNAASWKEYLVNVTGPYVTLLAPINQQTPSVVTLTWKDDSLTNFFDSLCADPTKYKSLEDYKFLRKHPLYKHKDQYIFVFLNFFIDKLYHAIKFDFGSTIIESGLDFKKGKLKSLADFLKYYGEDFAEKGLFYEVIEYCFRRKKNYVLIRGEELKSVLKGGEPDYYIRDRSKIYLFEFKDSTISQAAKNSNNYEKIIQELNLKMYENEKGSPKGIRQIVNSVEVILQNTYHTTGIDSFDPNHVIIYPIIIFTDFCFNTQGINYYLNQEFLQLLSEKNIKSDIRPLTLIDIDNFIKFQDLFRENKIALNQCLNYYHEITQKTSVAEKVFTFNSAIHELTRKMKYDTPKMFWDTVTEIIESQGHKVIDKPTE